MQSIYHYILFLFVLFEFGYSEAPYFNLFELNQTIIADIENNKIVTIKTNQNFGNAEHYQVYGIVNADMKKVFEAVENFNNYSQFMPRFDYVETIQNSDTLTAYVFNIILPLNIKYKYKIKSKEFFGDSSAWLAWETIPWKENSINETWGQWYLTPYKGSSNKTLIQYQVYTDPGNIPFGFRWIADIMTKKSLPETVDNLKMWVEKNEN